MEYSLTHTPPPPRDCVFYSYTHVSLSFANTSWKEETQREEVGSEEGKRNHYLKSGRSIKEAQTGVAGEES